MQATILTVISIAALVQARFDYKLQCNKEDMRIRWPSYHSQSDYYACKGMGGEQVKLSCPSGQLFTFVYQACTSPDKYIPPPSMNRLPTAVPVDAVESQHIYGQVKPSLSNSHMHTYYQPQLINKIDSYPKPYYPGGSAPELKTMDPPIINGEYQNKWELSSNVPPLPNIDVQLPPVVHDQDKEKVVAMAAISNPSVSNALKPVLSSVSEHIPLPPTPSPTPPVVQTTKAPKKKPQTPAKSSKKPTPAAKKPKAPNSKKPTAPTAKKTSTPKSEKKA